MIHDQWLNPSHLRKPKLTSRPSHRLEASYSSDNLRWKSSGEFKFAINRRFTERLALS